jgi:hypothetical protein
MDEAVEDIAEVADMAEAATIKNQTHLRRVLGGV